MKTFKLILLGLLTFIVTALWLTPTAFVAPYIQSMAPHILIAGGNGTIWNGSANNLQISGTNLGQASWKVHPFKSLISLSLVADVEVNGPEISAEGLAAYAYDRSIRLTDMQFEAESSLVSKFQPMVKLAGKFQGLINSAELRPNSFPAISGIVNWVQGSVQFPMRLAPGNYQAVISSKDDTLTATIQSPEAPLALDGTASLNSQWQYQTDIIAKAKPGTPPLLTSLLRSTAGGNASADGSVTIERKGTIKPIPLYQ